MGSILPDMGNYKAIAKIGSGASGIVYKVVNEDGHYSAMKIFKNVSDAEIDMEIECLKRVKQVCGDTLFCYIEDVNIDHNGVRSRGIITEYLDGYIDMFRFITPRTPLSDIEKIRDQCIQAFLILARIGVAHNDANDTNIMVKRDEDGIKVKIIDFGKCSLDTQDDIQTTFKDLMLTFAYMLTDFGKYSRSFFEPFVYALREIGASDQYIDSIMVEIETIE